MRIAVGLTLAVALTACTTTAPLGPVGYLPSPVSLPPAGRLAVRKAQASIRILHTDVLEARDLAIKAHPEWRPKLIALTRCSYVGARPVVTDCSQSALAVQAVLDLSDAATAATLNVAMTNATNALADVQAAVKGGPK